MSSNCLAGELTDWKMFVCRQMKIHQNQMSNINVTADKGETTIAAALTTTIAAAIKPDNNVMMHQQQLQQMLQHNKVSICLDVCSLFTLEIIQRLGRKGGRKAHPKLFSIALGHHDIISSLIAKMSSVAAVWWIYNRHKRSRPI